MKETKHILYLALLVAILLGTAACSKKKYYEVPPGPGGEPIENPGQIIIGDGNLPEDTPEEDYPQLTDDKGNSIPLPPGEALDVEEGTYRLITIIPRKGLSIDGSIVTLPVSATGEVTQPTAFKGDVQIITVSGNSITPVNITLRSMTRELIIVPDIHGIVDDQIIRVKASLHGIAARMDVAGGFGNVLNHSHATNQLHYTTATLEGHPTENTLPVRLLGFAQGVSPYLVIEISTMDGKVHQVNLNIAQAVASFNTGNPDTPMMLPVLIEKGLEEITGTIKPWKPGESTEIEGE